MPNLVFSLRARVSNPDDKFRDLVKAVKQVVDVKAELKVVLIILLAEWGYAPVDRDEVFKDIFEQAENLKQYSRMD